MRLNGWDRKRPRGLFSLSLVLPQAQPPGTLDISGCFRERGSGKCLQIAGLSLEARAEEAGFVCAHVCLHLHTCVCMCACLWACAHLCVCVRVCAYTRVCVCVYVSVDADHSPDSVVKQALGGERSPRTRC